MSFFALLGKACSDPYRNLLRGGPHETMMKLSCGRQRIKRLIYQQKSITLQNCTSKARHFKMPSAPIREDQIGLEEAAEYALKVVAWLELAGPIG